MPRACQSYYSLVKIRAAEDWAIEDLAAGAGSNILLQASFSTGKRDWLLYSSPKLHVSQPLRLFLKSNSHCRERVGERPRGRVVITVLHSTSPPRRPPKPRDAKRVFLFSYELSWGRCWPRVTFPRTPVVMATIHAECLSSYSQ